VELVPIYLLCEQARLGGVCYTRATGLGYSFSPTQGSAKKEKGSTRAVNDDVREEAFELVLGCSKAFKKSSIQIISLSEVACHFNRMIGYLNR